eukprot:CAMPEP_0168815504 /NCGR_PEP_ID=MMETSP0726-20121227/6239_1 /TAXON_ID=265536 /ORGANISM="Amphiprora sp., Strain CCMP467" /LENGTH=398 /DNA_ID=CAMNT_0008867729 /DNA_START=83 /DNA_END=1279 /DNA_ORIENTATION=+
MAPQSIETFRLLARLLSNELRCGCDTRALDETKCNEKTLNDFKLSLSRNYDRVGLSACALSLAHEEHLDFDHLNPTEAENSAYSLLSRNINFEVETTQPSADDSIGEATLGRIQELGNLLLLNVSESFALLVDSRLRAHATFLARHGLSVSKQDDGFALLNKKLGALLDLGNRVAASRIETKFEVAELPEKPHENNLSCALDFRGCLDLGLESLDGKGSTSVLPVRFESTGSLTFSVEDCLCNIKLDVDCRKLLVQMKQLAADIVAHVVEATNSLFVLPEPKLSRHGDSFLVMPPPSRPSLHPQESKTSELEALDDGKLISASQPVVNYALVSPDVSSTPASKRGVTPFLLDNDVTSTLSPNQCATILDGVFEDLDLDLFPCHATDGHDRPSKKARIS